MSKCHLLKQINHPDITAIFNKNIVFHIFIK